MSVAKLTKLPAGYSPLKQAVAKAAKPATLKGPKKIVEPKYDLSKYLGVRTTASAAAEGRLKVASKSATKRSTLKSLISRVKSLSKAKKTKATPYLNVTS